MYLYARLPYFGWGSTVYRLFVTGEIYDMQTARRGEKRETRQGKRPVFAFFLLYNLGQPISAG